MSRPGLILDVLSMLAMDDESPWMLHNGFIAEPEWEYRDLEVSEVLATLDEIERRGWANPYAPIDDDPQNLTKNGPPTLEYWKEARADYEDFLQRKRSRRSVPQEYGPWYHLTPSGKAEFRRLEGAGH